MEKEGSDPEYKSRPDTRAVGVLSDLVVKCFGDSGLGVNVLPKVPADKDHPYFVPFQVEVKSDPSDSWKVWQQLGKSILQYNQLITASFNIINLTKSSSNLAHHQSLYLLMITNNIFMQPLRKADSTTPHTFVCLPTTRAQMPIQNGPTVQADYSACDQQTIRGKKG